MNLSNAKADKKVLAEEKREQDLEEKVLAQIAGTPLYARIKSLKNFKGDEHLLGYEDYDTNLTLDQVNAIFRNGRTKLYSNCYGSIVYCLSAERQLKNSWRFLENQIRSFIQRNKRPFYEGILEMIDSSDSIYVFPRLVYRDRSEEYFRPGYVGFQFISDFMSTAVIDVDKKDAVFGIVKFSTIAEVRKPKPEYRYLIDHCALYLGEHDGEDIIFHQENTGKRFSFDTVQGYMAKNPVKVPGGLNEEGYDVRYYRLLNWSS